MKHYSTLVLLLVFMLVSITIKAQNQVRPYDEWEATQFVSLNGHQPSDYVTPDNNWEILYNLRTPYTVAELRKMGIKCSDSQLLLLEVGGLISKTKGKWKTTIPILDKEQTCSLRDFSKEVAESIYTNTKTDFIALAKAIDESGFKNNSLSLIFSYLLDGRMWTKLVLFEDINNNASWSGCYWVLYEPRTDFACGTNGYGEQDLILTYNDADIAPDSETMDECAAEIAKSGKITNPTLISKLQPYGLVNKEGDVSIPIIRKQQDNFHRINDKLVQSISTELKNNCDSLSIRYGIEQENIAMVILYHEVMWNLVDKLIQDKIISTPPIFKDKVANKKRLNDVLFFVEGGLIQ